jgi:outer membrane receptor protein involved in Fe transport
VKLRGEISLQKESLSVFEDVYLTVAGRYAGAQDSAGRSEPFFQFDQPPPPFGTASTRAYSLLDIAAGATISATGTEIAIGAENLLNTEYRDFLDTYKIITLGPGLNITSRVTQPF